MSQKRSRQVRPRRKPKPVNNGATIGHEAKLWEMANALRGSMDAYECKHVVLGLIFLKYVSDAFEEKHAFLKSRESEGYNSEDSDEYLADTHAS